MSQIMEFSKIWDLGDWDSRAIKNYSSISKIQKEIRRGNWSYICHHPEIRAIIRVILREAVNIQPKGQDIRKFVANFVNCNQNPLLVPMINAQLKYVNEQLKRGRWGMYDAEGLFMESQSTHSLLSTASTESNVHPVLTYALVFKKPDECDIDNP
ncbi:uncharacterized protein Dwil_GK20535 [Drosophila willistoni]|uniref:GK20535 n=1 Tax=Drosophila willistoni TaxID=7260 RepID=B4N5A3_DROWI|nr:uncharacterized protein LOC6645901 [Drosophila willistoni]EDW79542.1 uncharacterized protein Dwil_GK20535 [Drosophila willistoni]